jgi:Microtubule binding
MRVYDSTSMLNTLTLSFLCLCRRLHNTIQELKGNIRVFARIRPALSSSSSNSDAAVDATQYAATQGLTVQLPDNDPEKRKLILFGPARETVSGSKGELKSYDFQVCLVCKHMCSIGSNLCNSVRLFVSALGA